VPDQQQTVSTVFKAVDQSTGPLARVAKEGDKMASSMERAKAATEKALAGKVPHVPGAAGVPKEHMPPAITEAEKGAWEEAKAARMAMRKRRMTYQVGEAQEQLMQRAMMSSNMTMRLAMDAVSGESKNLGQRIEKAATGIEMLGVNMLALGGPLGAAGGKIAKFAGVVSLVTGAWEMGGALMEGAMKLGGEAATARRVAIFGARNEAEMEASEAAKMGADEQRILNKRVAAAARELGAMPVDRTGKAMDEWNEAVDEATLAVLRNSGLTTVSYDKARAALEEQAKGTMASVLADNQRKVAMNAAVAEHAMRLGVHTLGTDRESQERRNAAYAYSTQKLLDEGSITEAEITSTYDRLAAQSESMRSTLEQANTSDELTEVFHQVKKNLKVLPLHATAAQIEAFNQQLWASSVNLAKGFAEAHHLAFDPGLVTKIFSEARATAKEKQHNIYDFRHSLFNIKQMFAEGFDPDRMAVAFTSDLAMSAERRTTSALAHTATVQ
jgi:hypothetical protein